jgi:hypothetical protein
VAGRALSARMSGRVGQPGQRGLPAQRQVPPAPAKTQRRRLSRPLPETLQILFQGFAPSGSSAFILHPSSFPVSPSRPSTLNPLSHCQPSDSVQVTPCSLSFLYWSSIGPLLVLYWSSIGPRVLLLFSSPFCAGSTAPLAARRASTARNGGSGYVYLPPVFPPIHLPSRVDKDALTGPRVTALLNVQPSPVVSICVWAGRRPSGPSRHRQQVNPPTERLILPHDTANVQHPAHGVWSGMARPIRFVLDLGTSEASIPGMTRPNAWRTPCLI